MNGIEIAERMGIEKEAGVWIFADCVVCEVPNDADLHAFEVYMATANESIVCQTVLPADIEDMEQCREDLESGDAPTGGWEDGLGKSVCPDNGEIVDGGYSIEEYNGNDGSTSYHPTAEEAIKEAESDWDHLSEGDRQRYSDRSKGARFEVMSPDGRVVRDLVEERVRARERARFEGEAADYLQRGVIEALRNRRGSEWVDSAYALADGWTGTEGAGELMHEYGMDQDEAMDMLDALMAIHAIRLEEDEE